MRSTGLKPRTDFKLPFGADFYRYMDDAVRECFAAILVISKAYIDNNSWARIEFTELIARHTRGQMFLIPLLIDDVSLDMLPFGLQTIRHIDNSSRDLECLHRDLLIVRDSLFSYGYFGICPNHCIPANARETAEVCERRIRVQVTDVCKRASMGNPCPWCHWDQFDRKTITPQPGKVLSILEKLKDTQSNPIYPRPRVEFTFTGGEPLDDMEHLQGFLDICEDDGYVVTNGVGLSAALKALQKSHLGNIRIGFQPKQFPETQYDVIQGIRSLLNDTAINIRFNHVLSLTSERPTPIVNDIKEFIARIMSDYSAHLGERIKGIAFIEPYYDKLPSSDLQKRHDILDIGEKWAKEQGRNVKPIASPSSPRKKAYFLSGKLEIEFIKVNCDVTDDYVKRCLSCAVEKDISISADGRVRICTGWTQDMKPEFVYQHFSESYPLIALSGVVRRQFATVGFYAHLPLLTAILRNNNTMSVPAFFGACPPDTADIFSLLSGRSQTFFREDAGDIWRILTTCASCVLQEDNRFVRLYEEGSCDSSEHDDSIDLCNSLIRIAYQLANDLSSSPDKPDKRKALLTTLLLLEYLCVDESLFATARTVLVRGMSTELLREVSRFQKDVFEGLWNDAVFCLGAIAMENVRHQTVEKFILAIATKQQIKSAPQIQYVLGCVYRQNTPNSPEKAAQAFSDAVDLASNEIGNPQRSVSHFKWLCEELLPEAQRSHGVTCGRNTAAMEKADYYSIIYGSKLRYHALFSDGYGAMCRYFQENGSGNEEERDANKRRALRCFSESLLLAPRFYACLVRMGILEVVLAHTEGIQPLQEKARIHLSQAKAVFAEKGLLTDQEYLNSLLCEYAYAVADETVSPSESIPDPVASGIQHCQRLGKGDVECVRNDAEFLYSAVDRTDRSGPGRTSIIGAKLRHFIEECDELLKESF